MRLKLCRRFVKMQNFISSFNLEYEHEHVFHNFTIKYYVNVSDCLLTHYLVLALKGKDKVYTFQLLPSPKINTLINGRYLACLKVAKDFLLSDEILRDYLERMFNKFEFREILIQLINNSSNN